MDFLNEAYKIKEELISIRRDLHEHPELGFEEYRTSKKIKDFLTVEGIPFKEMAKTGVVAVIEGKGDLKLNNKCIALRADMDALPINDKKACSYKSKECGKMHACGHDAHTTILLGAARILNNNKNLFSGKVKLIFEPAEETVGGAKFMIDEGALDSPNVDAIIGLHVAEDIEVNKIKVKKGVVNAASNPFTIKIKGKGGHGAAPNYTVDPIVISSQVILALQTLSSREISPVNPIVLTIGAINGGTAQNIIPDEVVLKGIIRTMTKEDREYAKKRVCEIVEGITKTMRGDYEIDIEESYPCLYNDDSMVDILKKSAEKVLKKENVEEQRNPKMGVESFAYFANQKPAVFYFLGSGNKNKKIDYPAHNAMFDIDEECLMLGVAIQCSAVIDYLTSK